MSTFTISTREPLDFTLLFLWYSANKRVARYVSKNAHALTHTRTHSWNCFTRFVVVLRCNEKFPLFCPGCDQEICKEGDITIIRQEKVRQGGKGSGLVINPYPLQPQFVTTLRELLNMVKTKFTLWPISLSYEAAVCLMLRHQVASSDLELNIVHLNLMWWSNDRRRSPTFPVTAIHSTTLLSGAVQSIFGRRSQ